MQHEEFAERTARRLEAVAGAVEHKDQLAERDAISRTSRTSPGPHDDRRARGPSCRARWASGCSSARGKGRPPRRRRIAPRRCPWGPSPLKRPPSSS